MRVKVSKTCELEEVSELVVCMLVDAKKQLTALSEQKFNYWAPEVLVKQISDLRFSLADVDLSLEDAQSIVDSYIKTINNPAALLAVEEDVGEHMLAEPESVITEDTADE
tara:strand:- start:2125 stop:2454 length:330 start_codon:yes stop_codon:yes gene_type:complete